MLMNKENLYFALYEIGDYMITEIDKAIEWFDFSSLLINMEIGKN